MNSKRHLLRLTLLLIVFTAGVSSAYSIWNYQGNVATSQNQITQQNMSNNFNGQGNTGRNRNNPSHQGSLNNQTTPGISGDSVDGGQPPSGDSPQHMGQSNGQNVNGRTSSGTQHAWPILAYSVVFFALVLKGYYLFVYRKVQFAIQHNQRKLLIFTIICTGFLLRLCLATWINGHPYDLSTFQRWANSVSNNFTQFYTARNSSDYPPLYIYVLFLVGKISSLSMMSPYATLLLKLPSILADVATSFIIYKLAQKYLSWEISALLSAFYLFNPAIFINSTVWGQVDSFFTLIVIASVVLLVEKKIGLATAFFMAAILMKPQGIIFLPVLGFELLRQVRQKSWKNISRSLFTAMITAVVIILPFSLSGGPAWILKLYTGTLGEYPYASVNAFNFFSLLGENFAKDTGNGFVFNYHTWGLIFIVLIAALAWLIYVKGKNVSFAPVAALLLIVGVFVFSTRMHERYLFPAVALALLAYIYLRDRRFLLLAIGFSLTIYVNTHYVLVETLKGINSVPFDMVLILTSFFNVILFGYLVKVAYDIALRKKPRLINREVELQK